MLTLCDITCRHFFLLYHLSLYFGYSFYLFFIFCHLKVSCQFLWIIVIIFGFWIIVRKLLHSQIISVSWRILPYFLLVLIWFYSLHFDLRFFKNLLFYVVRDISSFYRVPYDFTVILIILPIKKSSFPHTDLRCCGIF